MVMLGKIELSHLNRQKFLKKYLKKMKIHKKVSTLEII